jgi:hypothetical protein
MGGRRYRPCKCKSASVSSHFLKFPVSLWEKSNRISGGGQIVEKVGGPNLDFSVFCMLHRQKKGSNHTFIAFFDFSRLPALRSLGEGGFPARLTCKRFCAAVA